MWRIEYPAIMTSQIAGGHDLVFFAAPAMDIHRWAGIPQKKGQAEQEETTGFQRDENPKRIEALVAFMKDPHNIIQNPLLCASQSDGCGKVVFVPDTQQLDIRSKTGRVIIEVDDLSSSSLVSLMRRVKLQLERRVPELASHAPDPSLVAQIRRQLAGPQLQQESDDEHDNADALDVNGEEPSTESTHEAAEVVFSNESHILDFWHELAARIQVLDEIGPGFSATTCVGFTAEAMIAFLKPVVVMDGQHRLRGAINTAVRISDENPECLTQIEQALERGEDREMVQARVARDVSRWLPVSLLMSTDPAEHVFQFIVVNQTATPIGTALLGTIVSTTLSNEELERVSARLTAADIKLDQSRAVAFLTRNPASPFRDRVETGMAGESSDRLAWSVMASLVKIFQRLQGGRLFGQKIDFADKWRRDCLDGSGIVSQYSAKGFDSAFGYWSSDEGPWREVFMAFFSAIRNEFGKEDPAVEYAYWGNPKKSNLFNKISLTILAADFFQFLVDRQYGIYSPADVSTKVAEWLSGVSRDYFNRDWKLENTKKDSVGIRGSWAKLWVDYRKDPIRLPKSSEYRKNL